MTFQWMMFICFCFSTAIASTIEDDMDVEPDPDLADYLREALENFRSQMTTGIPEINMPVLDPLHLEDMDIDVKENVADLHLRINEMFVKGLSNFTLNNIEPNLEEFYILLNLSLPCVLITGEYNLNGKLMSVFPIYGDGNYTINVTKLDFGGAGQIHFTTDTIQMDVLMLELNFLNVAMDLGTNFLGGGRFGEVMQEVIPGVGRDVFMLYKPLILRKLQKALQDEINQTLNKSEIKNLIKDIIPLQG